VVALTGASGDGEPQVGGVVDVAPEWSGREGYEIEFDGAPTMRANLVLGTQGEDHTDMGCLATAMHAVHAIAVVHAAAPGVLDLADVRDFVGRPF
jgi:hypothetical protein